MFRKLLGVLALCFIAAPGTLHAQRRWRFEIRGGPAAAPHSGWDMLHRAPC